MKQNRKLGNRWMAIAVAWGVFGGAAGTVYAHCDTMTGPLIPEARLALEKGDVTPLLKWVKKDTEAEVQAAFAKAVVVRAKGAEAKELADHYFLETLVRLHRAGEGAPYTGIVDRPASPFEVLVDRTIEEGTPDALIARMSGHLAGLVKEKFARVVETRKNKDKSVEAGRDYVEAYVGYIHYLENVHKAIMSGGAHPAEGVKPEAGSGAIHAGH